jgi:hypothetical protein
MTFEVKMLTTLKNQLENIPSFFYLIEYFGSKKENKRQQIQK